MMDKVKKVTEDILQVSAIKNGTVLDHIPANQLFKVISILGSGQELLQPDNFWNEPGEQAPG
jgi:aspartate carbamoyltransferase regulatory subunit